MPSERPTAPMRTKDCTMSGLALSSSENSSTTTSKDGNGFRSVRPPLTLASSYSVMFARLPASRSSS